MVTNYFGGCPHSGDTGGYLNIGREHWFVCDKHKTKWRCGSNLFSNWQDETDETWQRNHYKLATYREVEPLPEGSWSADPDRRKAELATFEGQRKAEAAQRSASYANDNQDDPDIPF
jgi:hypothetical protein